MKHDNQWRPRETGGSGKRKYQRQRNKDWTTVEEGKSVSRHYNRRTHSKYNSGRQPNYKLEIYLINKYINKPFDEFLHTWHERTKLLRNQGVVLNLTYIDPKMTDIPNKRDVYYVDMKGIIRINPNYHNHGRKKQPIQIIDKEIIKYRLRPDILNNRPWVIPPFKDILYILRKYLSVRDYNDIMNGSISQETYRRLINNSRSSSINYAIDRFAHKHNTEILKIDPYAYRDTYHWCRYSCLQDLFTWDNSESICRYIYPGTPEFTRYIAEVTDAERKYNREYKQRRNTYCTNLLHNIEADRKAKEDALNDQKIAKHGFDKDESFRGEEYHGQKRKKRKGDWAIDA